MNRRDPEGSPPGREPPGLVEVAVALPLPSTYHYRLPPSLAAGVVPGMRVVVPLGPRRVTGYVLGFPGVAAVDEQRLRDVVDLLDAAPLLSPELLELAQRAARYYAQPPGEMLRAALPAGINVSGRRTVRLVPQAPGFGLQAAGPEESPPRARQRQGLLAVLGPEPRLCAEVLRQAGQGSRMQDLLELERQGLVELGFDLPQPRVRTRRVTQVRHRATSPETRHRLGRRQQEVLALLAERQQLTLEELRGLVPVPLATLRGLAAHGLLELAEVEEPRDPFRRDPVVPDHPPRLTPGQEAVLAPIGQALQCGGFSPFLLHGETGSGKTEVYLEAIRQARALQRSALVLVPEISLTPQLAGRFRARFGDLGVAVLHSGLSEGERYDQWRRIRSGEVGIVVGARSAVFAPLQRLGVIVVDEEHDPSYHQDEAPRYDARNLALLRGQSCQAVVILGSATPSLESHRNALQGRYRRLELKGRPTGGGLPAVELVDLRAALPADRSGVPWSPQLLQAMADTLAAKEQIILFLNRRGYAPVVVCKGCGEAVTCPSCSVALTFHKGAGLLRCHYCDHGRRPPEVCPACGGGPLLLLGLGTEKVEAAVRALFPAARVARLDRDTVSRRGIEALIRAVREGEVDVLIGTQMVAKGHDFPNVTLVGVILADLGLRIPDFRAAERTFQLLAQVAGRAGRRERPGRVIIQTYAPGHHALLAAKAHDFARFSDVELALRRELGFPPFTHLLAVHLDGPDVAATRAAAQQIGQSLEQALLAPGALPVTLLGPAPAPLEKLRGRHRWQLLLKAARREPLRAFLPLLGRLAADAAGKGVRAAIDVDPISML